MKVKARKRRVKWVASECGCCDIVFRKARLNDYQILKEALDELDDL